MQHFFFFVLYKVVCAETTFLEFYFFGQPEVVLGSTTSTLIFFLKILSQIHFIMIY